MMARARAAAASAIVALAAAAVQAHDGPPFPILENHVAGPYRISIWTDPDTTDDQSPGGQFWIRVYKAAGADDVPAATRAAVSIRPVDRAGSELRAQAEPVRGDISNQFAALVMDHEGRFAVHVAVEGPLGSGAADAQVDATYDLRPPRAMLLLYLAPFLLVGVLWGRLLLRRRPSS